MTLFLVLSTIGAGVIGLHFLLVWMGTRGLIFYPDRGPGTAGVAARNALAEFEAVFNPAAEHLIEEERLGGVAETTEAWSRRNLTRGRVRKSDHVP